MVEGEVLGIEWVEREEKGGEGEVLREEEVDGVEERESAEDEVRGDAIRVAE